MQYTKFLSRKLLPERKMNISRYTYGNGNANGYAMNDTVLQTIIVHMQNYRGSNCSKNVSPKEFINKCFQNRISQNSKYFKRNQQNCEWKSAEFLKILNNSLKLKTIST